MKRNLIDMKNVPTNMLELILDECKQDPAPVFTIQIFRILIRPKMDQICNPGLALHYKELLN